MEIRANGNVRRSEDEWHAILARWEKSGTSVEEFCTGEKIAFSSFRRWQQRLRVSRSRRAQFVPVTVASSTSSNPTWALEVELPNGTRLRFQG